MIFGSGETVVVHNYTITGQDPYGQPIEGWTDVTVPGVAIAPRAGSESDDPARPVVIVGLTVYLPYSTAIGPRDEVTVRGDRFVVAGEPGYWRSPFTGWAPGIEVALSRAEG